MYIGSERGQHTVICKDPVHSQSFRDSCFVVSRVGHVDRLVESHSEKESGFYVDITPVSGAQLQTTNHDAGHENVSSG